jgi:hypothetical protein
MINKNAFQEFTLRSLHLFPDIIKNKLFKFFSGSTKNFLQTSC